jgi:hypothetical protein
MWRKLVATVLALSLPAGASAGPLKEAAERAGRELASAQRDDTRNRGRFWTGIALIGGGAVLAALGGGEVGGEDEGPNDPPEPNDGGEKTGKAMLAGGIAAAALGGVLLLTGRKRSGPVVSVQPGGVAVRHAVRF